MTRQIVRLSAKADLRILLEEVEADPFTGTLRIGKYVIDTIDTYYLNCKNAPSKENIILPGFGKVAIQSDPRNALLRFVKFCKSQHGQRLRVLVPFMLVLHRENV